MTVHTCSNAAYSSDGFCLCALKELHVITALCSEILTMVVHASICHKASEKDEDQKELMSNRSLSDCPCRAGEGIDGAL